MPIKKLNKTLRILKQAFVAKQNFIKTLIKIFGCYTPVRSAPATDIAGSTQWEKRAGSTVARGLAVLQLSNQNEVVSPPRR
jgi:hypothetical protein